MQSLFSRQVAALATASLTGLALVVCMVAMPATSSSATAAPATVAPGPGELTPSLDRRFERSGGEAQDFWVSFAKPADTRAAADIEDWAERGEYVVDRLQIAAQESQDDTIDLLDSLGADYTSYWITNAIRIDGGDLQLARQLAAQPGVESVFAPVGYSRPDPVKQEPTAPRTGPNAAASIGWGVANIKADQVWDQYGVRGDGVVVASIDTGVQFDHPALVASYRGNNGDGTFSNDYNWFDATGTAPYPVDDEGHGTHTMGTMVGDDGAANRIGVAPGATWIAANGCCPSDQALLDSSQWMLAPTKADGTSPDAAKRPQVINNSWGSNQPTTDPFMEDIQQAWADAGIFGVWANGNAGPGCGTSGTPGSRTINYSVGAYDATNTIAPFSSRGPGQDGEVKPNISAPGAEIRSSYPGNRYALMNGTSMATPHVAGAVALLWSADPSLIGDIDATRALLDDTATDAADDQCGGTADDNPVYGEGRLDALALVAATQQDDVGTITGTITHDETGAPISGAVLTLTSGEVRRSSRTADDGNYSASVPAGDYDATVSAFGYRSATTTISVVAGESVQTNLRLAADDGFAVSGRVLDRQTGRPVPQASVTIVGSRFSTITGNDGTFAVSGVPGPRDYLVTIDGGKCTHTVYRSIEVDGDLNLTVRLDRRVDQPINRWFGDSYGLSCVHEPTRWIRGEKRIDVPTTFEESAVAVPVRLPFAFNYFGKRYTKLYISGKGDMSFWTDPVGAGQRPTVTFGIRPWWGGQLLREKGSVLSRLAGRAPNRTFTIEYRNVSLISGATFSHEVTFHENGDFVWAYKDIDPDDLLERGSLSRMEVDSPSGNLVSVYRTQFLYAVEEAVVDDRHQIRFQSPPSGTVAGRVVDKVTRKPVGHATVDLFNSHGRYLTRTTTDERGRYWLNPRSGQTYRVAVMKPAGYSPPSRATVRITHARQIVRLTTALSGGRMSVDAGPVTVRPGRAATITVRNTGNRRLQWRAATTEADRRARPGTVLDTTDIADSFPFGAETAGDDLWAGGIDPVTARGFLQEFSRSGRRTGRSIDLVEVAKQLGLPADAQLIPGDLAWVPSRRWVCMAFFRGSNDIVCADPGDQDDRGGMVTRVLPSPVGAFQVDGVNLTGLAYDARRDVFYAAARPASGSTWSRIYTLGGIDHRDPGTVLDSCEVERQLTGLAWNPTTRQVVAPARGSGSNGVVGSWALEYDPPTCAEDPMRDPWAPGTPVSGLDIDGEGNFVVARPWDSSVQVLAGDQGVNQHLDWLHLSSSSGILSPGARGRLRVRVVWSRVPQGLKVANIVLRGNGGRRAEVTIPVRLRH